MLSSCYHHVIIILSSALTFICHTRYVTTGLSKHLGMSQIASNRAVAWKRLTTGIVLLVFDEYFLLIRPDLWRSLVHLLFVQRSLGQTHGLDVQQQKPSETNLGSSPSFVGLKLSRTRFKSHSDHSTWSKDPTALHMEVVRDGFNTSKTSHFIQNVIPFKIV